MINIDLKGNISSIFRINDTIVRALQNLGVSSLSDLIFRFPTRYENTSHLTRFTDFINSSEQIATICVKLVSASNLRVKPKLTLQNFVFLDKFDGKKINVKSFNKDYLVNSIRKDNEYYLKIKKNVNKFGRTENFLLDIEKVDLEKGQLHVGTIAPVYKLTKGISVKYYRRMLHKIFFKLLKVNKSLNTLINNHFDITFEDLYEIHFPKSLEKVNSIIQKLSLYEIATIYIKLKHSKSGPFYSKVNYKMTTEFTPLMFSKILNVNLSHDQETIMRNIYEKYKSNQRFDILVQGDVGSGKSFVAFYALILNYFSNTNSLLLAPTSVLVDQHFENLSLICNKLNINLKKLSKNNKTTIEDCEHSIIVGTTALNFKKITNVGLVVFDEQQKFGVLQKEQSFFDEMSRPNFIEMTATPIPRTILRCLFDDLEVYSIKMMPFGTRKVKTFFVRRLKSNKFYAKLIEKVNTGVIKKCLVVVPASESDNFMNVENFSNKLKSMNPNIIVSSLTGNMSEKKKLVILDNFKNGQTQFLVATSIVEIGINIPDLDVILIVSPQMFGLSQLHQIRGRVGRTGKEGMCFLIEEEELNELQLEKIVFFTKNNDGMSLAEKDFQMRGPGDLLGDRQIGMPNFKIASFVNLDTLNKGIDLGKKILDEGEVSSFIDNNPFYFYDN